jgi:hypothetical protein
MEARQTARFCILAKNARMIARRAQVLRSRKKRAISGSQMVWGIRKGGLIGRLLFSTLYF